MTADQENMNRAGVRSTNFVPRIVFIYFRDMFKLAYAKACCSGLL